MRYYIDYSSWFDSHIYHIPKIKSAIQWAGGKNIRLAYNYGWSNQPKVVTFNAEPDQVRWVLDAVRGVLGTEWVILRVKDW